MARRLLWTTPIFPHYYHSALLDFWIKMTPFIKTQESWFYQTTTRIISLDLEDLELVDLMYV